MLVAVRDEYQEHWLREHRWKVALTTIGVLGFLGMWVVKWANEKEREETIASMQRLEQEIRSLPPPAPVMPEDPPPAPPPPPVRFRVVAGDQAADVVGGAAILNAGGTGIAVHELADAEFAAAGVAFRHASRVSVAPAPDGSVVAAVEGASLVLATLAPGEEMAPGFPGTGADEAAAVQRRIAGALRDGMLHRRSSGVTVETYALDLGKRRIGIALYRDGDGREVGPLEEILGSIGPSNGTRGPRFELLLGDAPKTEIALDDARRQKSRVAVRRRPTIRRTIGALELEHPWSLAVSPLASDAVTSVVVLRGRSVGIRLVALPMAMTVAGARSSLLGHGEVRGEEEVEAVFGGDEVRGKRYALASDIADDVRAELFVIRRGGKHIGAAVIYRESEQGDALALAEPVLTSVH